MKSNKTWLIFFLVTFLAVGGAILAADKIMQRQYERNAGSSNG